MNPPVAPPPFWPKALPTEIHVPRAMLWESLERAARSYPDKTAYRVYGQSTSFADLWRDTQRLSGWLQQHCGLKRGDRVMLSGQSSSQFVTAYQAILRAGAVVVPVNPMYLTDEFAHLAEDSGARLLIAAQELWPRVEPLLGRGIDQAIVFSHARPGNVLDADTPDWFRAAPAPITDARVARLSDALAAGLRPAAPEGTPDDLCLIAYTSGTTARPKGCTQTHRSLLTAAVTPAIWRSDTPDLVFLGASPMFHMQGLQAIINTTMALGASVVLLPRWDAKRAAELIRSLRVNRFGASPPMLVDLLAVPGLKADALDSVGVITGGGAALAESVNKRLADELDITYLEGYGMTETCSMVMCNPPRRVKRQCLGIPTFGVHAMVVGFDQPGANARGGDDRERRTLDRRRAGQPAGLLAQRRRESRVLRRARRQALVAHGRPGHPRCGWLLLPRRSPQAHDQCGRLQGLAVRGRVTPAPASRSPGGLCGRDAGPAPRRTGHGRSRHAAWREPSPQALIEWSRGQMAPYKCPRTVEFVERLPRAGTGKIDWRGLQESIRTRDAAAAAEHAMGAPA